MNNQQAFDKMVTHLFTQKCKAEDMAGRCAYRGVKGLKCAVGALISDDDYNEGFEGKTIREFADDIPSLLHVSTNMLGEMQTIHDAYGCDEWFKECRKVATRYNLDCAVLKTFEEVEL